MFLLLGSKKDPKRDQGAKQRLLDDVNFETVEIADPAINVIGRMDPRLEIPVNSRAAENSLAQKEEQQPAEKATP